MSPALAAAHTRFIAFVMKPVELVASYAWIISAIEKAQRLLISYVWNDRLFFSHEKFSNVSTTVHSAVLFDIWIIKRARALQQD